MTFVSLSQATGVWWDQFSALDIAIDADKVSIPCSYSRAERHCQRCGKAFRHAQHAQPKKGCSRKCSYELRHGKPWEERRRASPLLRVTAEDVLEICIIGDKWEMVSH